MTVKLGIYAMFLLKMVVEGVYFKNLMSAMHPWAIFFIDVISHALFFPFFSNNENLVHYITIYWYQIKANYNSNANMWISRHFKKNTGHLPLNERSFKVMKVQIRSQM